MSTYLVQYAGAQHRSAAGFGGEWDADRRHATRRPRLARAARGRVWAHLRHRFDTTMNTTMNTPIQGVIIAR